MGYNHWTVTKLHKIIYTEAILTDLVVEVHVMINTRLNLRLKETTVHFSGIHKNLNTLYGQNYVDTQT